MWSINIFYMMLLGHFLNDVLAACQSGSYALTSVHTSMVNGIDTKLKMPCNTGIFVPISARLSPARNLTLIAIHVKAVFCTISSRFVEVNWVIQAWKEVKLPWGLIHKGYISPVRMMCSWLSLTIFQAVVNKEWWWSYCQQLQFCQALKQHIWDSKNHGPPCCSLLLSKVHYIMVIWSRECCWGYMKWPICQLALHLAHCSTIQLTPLLLRCSAHSRSCLETSIQHYHGTHVTWIHDYLLIPTLIHVILVVFVEAAWGQAGI